MKRIFECAGLLAIAGVLFLGAGTASAQLLIDHFTDSQPNISPATAPPPGPVLPHTATGSITGATIIGPAGAKWRNITVNLTGGDPGTTDSALVTGGGTGLFGFSRNVTTTGFSTVVWDGTNQSAAPGNFNPIGLQTAGVGIDLTVLNTQHRIRVEVKSNDVAGDVQLDLYTDATHASTATWSIPGGTGGVVPVDFDYSFLPGPGCTSGGSPKCVAFATKGGMAGPATFTNVGAVVMTVGNNSNAFFGEDIALDFIQTTTPVELQSFTAD